MQYFARLGDPDHYTREEFQKMELYMLRFFDWDVSHPTPAHYADYYLTRGDGLDEGSPSTSPAAAMPEGLSDPVARKVYMEMCNTYFIEAALKGSQTSHMGGAAGASYTLTKQGHGTFKCLAFVYVRCQCLWFALMYCWLVSATLIQ